MDFIGKSSGKLQGKTTFILEERARALAAQSKFYEAASYLEEVDFGENDTKLGVKLLMAECYMQLGRENKALRAMKEVKKILTSPPIYDVAQIIQLAEEYSGNSTYVRQLFLLKIAAEIFQVADVPPEEKLDGVYRCLNKTKDVTTLMVQSSKSQSGLEGFLMQLGQISETIKVPDQMKGDLASKLKSGNQAVGEVRLHAIAMDLGMENLLEMYDFVKSIDDVEPERKVHKVARAANAIGYVYVLAGENGKSIKARKDGMAAMERVYHANASKYSFYGHLCHNIGVACYNLDRYKEAEEYYLQAIAIYEDSLDFDDESERQTHVKKSKSDLKNTREKLA